MKKQLFCLLVIFFSITISFTVPNSLKCLDELEMTSGLPCVNVFQCKGEVTSSSFITINKVSLYIITIPVKLIVIYKIVIKWQRFFQFYNKSLYLLRLKYKYFYLLNFCIQITLNLVFILTPRIKIITQMLIMENAMMLFLIQVYHNNLINNQ